jgi:cytochrome P450
MSTQPGAHHRSAASAPPGCPAHKMGRNMAADAVSLSEPGFQTDPDRLYREMRREHGTVAPVIIEGGLPAWLVLGYRELHQAASDGELFSRDPHLWNQWDNVPENWTLATVIDRNQPSIFFTVGERHRVRAAVLSDALEAVDPFVVQRFAEQCADELIDGFCSEGGVDIMERFAMPYPVRVLAKIYGFPDDEGPKLAAAAMGLLGSGERVQAGQLYLVQAATAMIAEKKAGGRAVDLASHLMGNTAGFTDEEVLWDVICMLVGGHTLTADWIGNTLRVMLTDDRFAASLFGGRHSVAEAMNEVLWEDAPGQNAIGRWASRDTTLGNRHIKAGDMVMLGLAAANQDPEIRPNSSALTGGNNAYFSFGHGEHRCPFAAQEIAEIISRTAIEVLLDRLPDIDLAVPAEELIRRPSPWVRGLTALPVSFSPSPPVGPPHGEGSRGASGDPRPHTVVPLSGSK